MKKVALLTVAMLCVASLAFAQAGSIGIYGDALGTDCYISDSIPGLLNVYVVHVNTPAATASQFSVPTPACFLAPFLSSSSPFPVAIGNPATGIAIGYGGCFTGPIHVLTLQYFAQGLTGPCCFIDVFPDVTLSDIQVVDCASNLLAATALNGVVNGDGSCECGIPPTVPTQDTTWGQMKALYSE